MKFRSFWQAYNDPRQKIDFQPLTLGLICPITITWKYIPTFQNKEKNTVRNLTAGIIYKFLPGDVY